MARRQNYLNNRDMLKQIHISKSNFSWFEDRDRHHQFDVIIDNTKEEFNLILNKIKNNNGINSKFKKKLGNQIYKNQNFLKLIKLRDKKSQKEN